MFTFTSINQHNIGSLIAISNEKDKKGIQTGEEVKLSVFADDMTKSQRPATTKKLLETTNQYSKMKGSKVTYKNRLHI